MIAFVGLVLLAGIATMLAVAGVLYWEPWRMFHRPEHSAARRLRVDLPVMSATVPVRPVASCPPWPALPREWIEVHHDEYAPPLVAGNGHSVPAMAMAQTAARAAVPADPRRPDPDAGGPPSAALRPVPAVDARQLPNTAAWIRSAARGSGVAAWFARELAAA